MTSPRFQSIAAAFALAAASLSGCGSSSPDQTAVPTAAPSRPRTPPPPPPPSVTPVDQLMAQLGIDDRVYLAEEVAPGTDAERKAVLEFFDSFARGDDTALGAMLSKLDRDELDILVESGAWTETTSGIERIEVQTGVSPDGQACALAVFYVHDDFQPQLWYYKTDSSGTIFDAVAAPPNLMDRLHGTDWISAWFGILDEELALAELPDEEIVIPQMDLSDTSRSSSGGSGPSLNPSDPSPSPSSPGPGGPGKRPKRGKRPAPGKGR